MIKACPHKKRQRKKKESPYDDEVLNELKMIICLVMRGRDEKYV